MSKQEYLRKPDIAYKENPFANQLVQTIKTREKTIAVGQGSAVTGKNGESEEIAAIAIRKVIDKEEFLKVFAYGIAGIFDINKAAQELFKVILNIYLGQKFSPDRVYLSPATLEDYGYTRAKATRIRAMNHLLNANFLAEVANEQGWYWVNPTMFYKGDRLRIVRDYVVRGSKHDTETPLLPLEYNDEHDIDDHLLDSI